MRNSRQVIEQSWKKNGPFNAILGFSQGAILISTLLAKAVHEDFCVQPEAAILFGLIHDSVTHTHTLQSYIDVYIESMTLCEEKS
jgi:hypothetical protein